jgi:hypothetical protein
MPTIRVELSAGLITLGVRHSAADCPVALAVARFCPGCRRVCVVPVRGIGGGSWVCRVYGPGRRFRSGELPAAAAKWVAEYTDGAVGMEPMAFDLKFVEDRR